MMLIPIVSSPDPQLSLSLRFNEQHKKAGRVIPGQGYTAAILTLYGMLSSYIITIFVIY